MITKISDFVTGGEKTIFFFIASFAFVKQMHRAMPLPHYTFSDKENTH